MAGRAATLNVTQADQKPAGDIPFYIFTCTDDVDVAPVSTSNAIACRVYCPEGRSLRSSGEIVLLHNVFGLAD